MKLNLGCGYKKLNGWVNVDSDAQCTPDVLCDLNQTPWPFEADSVDEILFDNTLEHIGQSTNTWFEIWKEVYRICRPDAKIFIAVPHPRHDNFLVDPTHVRPVFPGTIAMMDQMQNIKDYEQGGQETKLGMQLGIDIAVLETQYDLCDPWLTQLKENKMSMEQLHHDLAHLNNVCWQIRIVAKAVKPQRALNWKPR